MTDGMAQSEDAYLRALRRIWILGDVHGAFGHLDKTLNNAQEPPDWIIFAGDIDIDHRPMREILVPFRHSFPQLQVAFVHGNHDADTYKKWECLHDAGDAVALHGSVVNMNGIQVAGLGGVFYEKVWSPPAAPKFMNKADAMGGGPYRCRGGQRPAPSYLGAIYPDDLNKLATCKADILVTHEAPSCHPFGNAALDDLARALGVKRHFHGHHHDDRSELYALQTEKLGFTAIGLGSCAIKNGLGELLCSGFQ